MHFPNEPALPTPAASAAAEAATSSGETAKAAASTTSAKTTATQVPATTAGGPSPAAASVPIPQGQQDDDKDNDETYRQITTLFLGACASILAFDGLPNGVDCRDYAFIIFLPAERGGKLISNDPVAHGIGQRPFKSLPDFDTYF